MDVSEIIGAIVLGLIAGYVAKALLPGDDPGGFVVTILLGIAGALIGYFLFTELLGIGDEDKFDLGGILGAIVGTMLLLLIYRMIAPDRTAPAGGTRGGGRRRRGRV